MPTPTAKAIVEALLSDIESRKGFRQTWEGLDEDIQQEIIAQWHTLVDNILDKSNDQKL